MDAVATAFIPVRGGSKGIPGKNLLPIGGRPLVDWVISAALGASGIGRVVVSTDDDAIATHVRASFPDAEVFRRGPETATDTASTESAMIEYLATDAAADPVVLLQATSPLTTANDIDAALALRGGGADCVVSVVRQKRFQWREVDGAGEPVAFDPQQRPRRQDHDGFLVENGAIYVMGRAGFDSSGCRVNGRVGLYEMPEDTYAELDEPSDVAVIDAALRRRGASADDAMASRIRLVITDVDGCLTDNGMYYGAEGESLKRFSARDGKGFELLRNAGVQTMLITSEKGPIIERRAEKLSVDFLEVGCGDKLRAAEAVRTELGLAWDEVAFLGDDVHDVALMRTVGLAACPSDATPEAAAVARFVCGSRGGFGAFRDLADLVTAARR